MERVPKIQIVVDLFLGKWLRVMKAPLWEKDHLFRQFRVDQRQANRLNGHDQVWPFNSTSVFLHAYMCIYEYNHKYSK